MTVLDSQRSACPLIPLARGADIAELTPPGLLKILRRTGNAIRDDGHWYAYPDVVREITKARRVLGLDRASRVKHETA